MEIENKVLVGVGDIKIDKAPKVLCTYLGSCVAVCLYSPSHHAGGMIHFMLPKMYPTLEGKLLKRDKFADTGIPEMVRLIKLSFNIEKENFVAKIFGGANVIKTDGVLIGEQNIVAARSILNDLKIKIINASTGGERGYKIDFDLATGKVFCQVFNKEVREY